ncbi:MAG: DUF2339 domain-containing protein [Acidimicrobiia bacterium]|nr:DUF2339 domain-containing protein [Acidimicrobiia bacterium]
MTTPSSTEFITPRALARLGLGLLLLALVFLFRWSIDQGFIGPLARVAIGAGASTVMIGIGLGLSRKRPLYARLLEGGGVAGLYMSAFAAHRLYDLMGTTEAFIQLVMVSAIAIGLAVREKAESLAVIGVIGAFAAPILIGGRLTGPPGEGGYVALVLMGVGLLYFLFGWRALLATASIGGWTVVLVDIVRILDHGGARSGVIDIQLAIAALWLTLLAIPLARAYLHPAEDQIVPLMASLIPSLTAFGASRLLWDSYGTVGDDYVWAALAGGLAVVHLGIAWAFDMRGLRDLSLVQLIPAVVFITAALSFTFEADLLVMALAAEGAGLVWIGRQTRLAPMETTGHILFGLVFAGAALAMFEPNLIDPVVLNSPALARLVIFGLAAMIAYTSKDDPDFFGFHVPLVYSVAAYVGSLGWIAWELSRLSEGQAWVTAAWGVFGVVLVLAGGKERVIRQAGLAAILLAVGKLFIVDLATVAAVWRMLLFAGFGLVLLAIGYWLDRSETDPAPELVTEVPTGPDSDDEVGDPFTLGLSERVEVM